MRAEARRALRGQGIVPGRQRFRFALDLRYLGQYHEVTVPVPERELLAGRWGAVAARFHGLHDRLYGYSLEAEATPVQLLNLRLAAIGETAKPALPRERRRRGGAARALKGRRPVHLPGARSFRPVPVYDGERLSHGDALRGPAVIETANTSIVVPPGWRARYDAAGNCILTA
jgi:N-methylhydantoinase A